MVPLNKLKAHPKNRNKHPEDQIKRLAEIIAYQGIRSPIKVSKRSGFITAGHGRLAALELLKIKEAPVNYQDYDSDEQEYADLQADNAIAFWAELDFSGINSDIGDLGPDFNIELLGLRNFLIESADKFIETPLSEEDFQIPKDVYKIVLIVENDRAQKDVLRILKIESSKKFQGGKLISARWPDIE
ncbi:MAG TPA: ParB N-terminal domain-containing protein [Candidatus Paceibacterota bacterium]|nr:ParB N-terminal domain-containing protein [Candidatus Paceibacterota bacterium]